MELKEKIEEVGLRPSDVVKLTNGEIKLSQASTWIKTGKMTKAAEQLLLRLCDEKVDQGLSFDKPGRKPDSERIVPGLPVVAVTPASFDGSEFKASSIDEILTVAPVKKSAADIKKAIPGLKTASEIPAKKDIEQARDTGASYDSGMNMKYKLIAGGLIRFSCDGRWWQASKGVMECYAGGRLVKMSELTLIG